MLESAGLFGEIVVFQRLAVRFGSVVVVLSGCQSDWETFLF